MKKIFIFKILTFNFWKKYKSYNNLIKRLKNDKRVGKFQVSGY